MEILYVLIPISLVFVLVGAGLFFWSVKSGQYDDLEGPAHRILMDDDDPKIPTRSPEPPPAPSSQPKNGNLNEER